MTRRQAWRELRAATGALALVAALALTGCAVSDTPTPTEPAPASTPVAQAPTEGAAAPAVTDAETCAALDDVLTITFNADLGHRQKRMGDQEREGWYRVATLMLDRVPVRGEGEVSEGVAALQAAAPPVATTAYGTTQIGSLDWDAAMTVLNVACEDAGDVLGPTSFTGG